MLISLLNNVFLDNLAKFCVNKYFILFIAIFLGFAIGRIKIKGVSLETAGVFIGAIIIGIFVDSFLVPSEFNQNLILKNSGITISSFKTMLKVIENIGLILFVTSVGFTAGPVFVNLFKKKATSFIGTSLVIILTGTLTMVCIVLLDNSVDLALGLGLLMGALTSTPGLTSARDLYEVNSHHYESVEQGHAISYPFGVLGVVLFVQILPKLLGANMTEEVAKYKALDKNEEQNDIEEGNLFTFDKHGFAIFSLAIIFGLLLGSITIPLGSTGFSLGTTGGTLIVGLIFGYMKKIGKFSLNVSKHTLSIFKELGIVLFLAGCGLNSGFGILENISLRYFIYGALITLLPMIVGYIVARYVFKMELLNRLGAITGGMTSTPALGALIEVAGTDNVAGAYASTYPIALFFLVIVPKILILIL